MTLGIFILGIISLGLAVFFFLFGPKFNMRGTTDSFNSFEEDEKLEMLNNTARPLLGRVVPVALIGIAGALLFNSFFVEVPAGTRGIRLTFKAASNEALETGTTIQVAMARCGNAVDAKTRMDSTL